MRYNQALITIIATSLFGCATVINGPTQTIRVLSSPANATVKFNDEVIGKTPLVYEMKRSKEGIGILEVSRDGYEPQRFQTYRRLSGAFWGNLGFLVIGGIPLMMIDGASGCWANVYPHKVDVTLDPTTVQSSR